MTAMTTISRMCSVADSTASLLRATTSTPVLSQIHWHSEPLSAAQSGAVMSTMMVDPSARRGGR